MYVSVGSSNNIDESGSGNERRATIHEYNPDGTGFRLFATGIRNPSVLTWQPVTNTLWTAVNERDGLGDELVPDYATSVKDGGFYGWPYSYFGNHVDTRVRNQQAGPRGQSDRSGHSDSGAFGGPWSDLLHGHSVSAALSQRLFVALHGSWNRSTTAGVKVIFVPFANNRPSGPPEDFLTGFVVDPSCQLQMGTSGRRHRCARRLSARFLRRREPGYFPHPVYGCPLDSTRLKGAIDEDQTFTSAGDFRCRRRQSLRDAVRAKELRSAATSGRQAGCGERTHARKLCAWSEARRRDANGAGRIQRQHLC